MKKLLPALLAATLLGGSSALATILDDPLHGEVCVGTTCSQTDNGQFSPITNLSGGFGWAFSGSPGANVGNLNIILLAPAGDGFVNTPTITGTNLSMPSALNFIGQWTAASNTDLAAFLGFPNSSPANPFGGFQVGLDTGVQAFNVFELNIPGILTIGPTSSTTLTNEFFDGGSIPAGVDLVAFLTNTSNGTVSTALSGQLQAQQLSTVPLPGAVFLFAPVLAFFGWLLRHMRMRRNDLQLA